MIQISKFNKRIKLLKLVPKCDEHGGYIAESNVLAEVWTNIIQNDIDTVIKKHDLPKKQNNLCALIRYTGAAKTADYVNLDGTIYQIDALKKVQQQHSMFLKIYISEVGKNEHSTNNQISDRTFE